MALNTLPNAGLRKKGYPSDRLVTPIIINGDMSVAQRATSATGKTGDGYYTIDRYQFAITSLGTWTFTQSTTVPSGQGFSYSQKADCTTADASPAAGDRIFYRQSFEGNTVQVLKKGTSNAEKFTVSFWVRSNKTGTYILELYDHDNSRHINKSYTINSADTWEKKIIVIDADTTGAFLNDNNLSLHVAWYLGAGSTYTSGSLQTSWGSQDNARRAVGQVNLADSTSNEWYITGVQLEVGEFDSTSIPSFPFESFENNLRKCCRYFQSLGVNSAMDVSATSDGKRLATGLRDGAGNASAQIMTPLIVPFRTNPSVTTNQVNCRQETTSTDLNSISVAFRGMALQISVTNTSNFNAGYDSMQLRCTGTNSYIRFDAEL